MHLSLRIVLIIITVIYLIEILKAVKNKKMRISFLVFWMFTGFALIIALAIPGLVDYITNLIGFEMPTNMIFCITIFIAFYLIFNLNILLSQESKKNVVLIQEVSMLKKRVEELEKDK